MKTQTTSVVGLMTGRIKNNPSIYSGSKGFTIFLNGELILRGTANEGQSKKKIFETAKECLEKLKFGTFEDEEIQKTFDSFIRK